MTRDEAMALWAKADRAGEDAYVEAIQAGAVTADDAHKTGSLAAATVIQQAFAERDGEIERLRDGLEQSLQGWENVAELNLIPGRYMDGAIKLAKVCRQALAAKGDSRG